MNERKRVGGYEPGRLISGLVIEMSRQLCFGAGDEEVRGSQASRWDRNTRDELGGRSIGRSIGSHRWGADSGTKAQFGTTRLSNSDHHLFQADADTPLTTTYGTVS